MRVNRKRRGEPLPIWGWAIAYAWLEQALAGEFAASTIQTDCPRASNSFAMVAPAIPAPITTISWCWGMGMLFDLRRTKPLLRN